MDNTTQIRRPATAWTLARPRAGRTRRRRAARLSHRSRPRRARRPLCARRGRSSTPAAGASSATTSAATAEATGARGRLAAVDDLLVDLARAIDAVRAEHPRRARWSCSATASAAWWRRASSPAPWRPRPAWSRPVDALLLSSPALDTGMKPLQKAMLAVLGPLTPNLAVANGLKPEWISRDAGGGRRLQAPIRWSTTGSRRGWRASSSTAASSCARAPSWTVPTLLMYAGSRPLVPPAGTAAFAAAAPKAVVSGARWFRAALPRDHERARAGRGVLGLRGWLTAQARHL